MGFFKRSSRAPSAQEIALEMRGDGIVPIEPESLEDFHEHLAEASFSMSLEERNAYANGAISWAASRSPETLEYVRHLVFAVEIARQARVWHEQFPALDALLHAARIEALLATMTTEMMGRHPDESYELFFGSGIPQVVDTLNSQLLDAMRDRSS